MLCTHTVSLQQQTTQGCLQTSRGPWGHEDRLISLVGFGHRPCKTPRLAELWAQHSSKQSNQHAAAASSGETDTGHCCSKTSVGQAHGCCRARLGKKGLGKGEAGKWPVSKFWSHDCFLPTPETKSAVIFLNTFIRVLKYWDNVFGLIMQLEKTLPAASPVAFERKTQSRHQAEGEIKSINKQQKYSYKSQELKPVWSFITAWNGKSTIRHTDKRNTPSIHLFNGTLMSWICHAHQNTESYLGIS